MIKKITLYFLVILFYPKILIGGENLGFGVLSDKDKDRFYGNPLIVFEDGSWNNYEKVLGRFEVGNLYEGLDQNGKSLSIKLLTKNINPSGDLYEQLLESKSEKFYKLPILFWTPGFSKPIFTESEKIKLTKDKTEFFNKRAKLLVEEAGSNLRDPYKFLKALKQSAISPKDNKDIITIFIPLLLKKDGKDNDEIYQDDRGSVFFIYNTKLNKIILEKFGHPEWSPEAENVNVIKPIFFFKLENASYCFCQYDEAWEHSGFALINLENGKVEMKSY